MSVFVPIIQSGERVDAVRGPRAQPLQVADYMGPATAKLASALNTASAAVDAHDVLAQAAADKAKAAQQKIDDEQGKPWAGDAAATGMAGTLDWFNKRVADMKPGDTGLVADTQKVVKDYYEQAGQNAPTPAARQFVMQHGQAQLASFTEMAAKAQSRADGAFAQQRYTNQVNNWSTVVAQDESQLPVALSSVAETATGIEPGRRVEITDQARNQVIESAAYGMLKRQPGLTYDLAYQRLTGTLPQDAAGAGGTGGAGAAAPDGSGAAPGPSGARGIRNNNPGNIVRSDLPWQGKVAGSDPKFETFATPEAGIRALAKNLIAYDQDHGRRTVQDIVTAWAPASENGDASTGNYVKAVSQQLGVKPDQPLDMRDPKVLTGLTTAIIQHENGGNPYKPEQVAGAVDSALNRTKLTSDTSVADLRAKPGSFDESEWDKRPDGTQKGRGFLGVLQRPDGAVMTEYSVGVEINGKEMDVPTLVPTLTRAEVQKVLTIKDDEPIPDSIINKASAFAKQRLAAGKPVFAQAGEEGDIAARSASAPVGAPFAAQIPADAKPGKTGNAVIDSMSVPQLVRFLSASQTAVHQQQAVQQAQLNQRLNDASAEYMTSGTAKDSPSLPELQSGFGQLRGLQLYTRLQDTAKTGNQLQQVKNLPEADLQQMVDQQKPVQGDGFAYRQQNYETLLKAIDHTRQLRKADSVQFALSVQRPDIAPITPQMLQDPAALSAEIARRRAAGPSIAKDYGTGFELFSKPEQKALSTVLHDAPVPLQKQYLASIFQGAGDMDTYKFVMRDLYKDAPVVANAGVLQAQNRQVTAYGGFAQRDVADVILRGNAILNPPSKDDGSGHMGGKSLIKMPEDKLMLQAFLDRTGKAYVGNEKTMDLAYQTYRAAYAGISAEQGGSDGAFDADRARAAVDLATGGIANFHGSDIVLPYGMPADKFKDQLGRRVVDIAPRANNATADELKNLALENVGDGVYAFRRGNSYVVDKKGAPLLVDFRTKLPPLPAPAPGQQQPSGITQLIGNGADTWAAGKAAREGFMQ